MFEKVNYLMVHSLDLDNSHSYQVNDIVQVVELYPLIHLLQHWQSTKSDLQYNIKIGSISFEIFTSKWYTGWSK